jgi:hypothetical protein
MALGNDDGLQLLAKGCSRSGWVDIRWDSQLGLGETVGENG